MEKTTTKTQSVQKANTVPDAKSEQEFDSASKRRKSAARQQSGRLSFLCDHHKDWVFFNSMETLPYLEQIQQKAEYLLEQQKFREALPFVGCAWESAAILLETQSGERTYLVNRYASLTVLLNICFEQLGESECALLARAQSVTLLSEISAQGDMATESNDYLLQCIAHLRNPDLYKMFLMPWPANEYANTLH